MVVLPLPFLPMIPTASPRLTSNETSLRAQRVLGGLEDGPGTGVFCHQSSVSCLAQEAEGGVGEIHQAFSKRAIAHNLTDAVALAQVFYSNSDVSHSSWLMVGSSWLVASSSYLVYVKRSALFNASSTCAIISRAKPPTFFGAPIHAQQLFSLL